MHLLDSDWVSGTWITASIAFGYYVITKLNSTAKGIKENAESIGTLSEIMVRQTEILRDNNHCMEEMVELMRFEAEARTGKKPPPYVRTPRENHKT